MMITVIDRYKVESKEKRVYEETYSLLRITSCRKHNI